MAIQEGYLSTSLRWALFKTDWPEGEIKFSESSSAELKIPKSFSKNEDEMFCVAQIMTAEWFALKNHLLHTKKHKQTHKETDKTQ